MSSINKGVIILLAYTLILTGCGNSNVTQNVDQTNQGVQTNTPDEIESTVTPEAIQTPTLEPKEHDNVEEIQESENVVVKEEFTDVQRNSISMLHYLTVTSSGIENSKHNKLYLEEVYSSLINNTSPDKIDKETQERISMMLDTVEQYRMISVKRNRLQYLYNQDKANLIREAMPNPLAVFTVANALDWRRMVGAITYTALDSYNNYKKAKGSLDKELLVEGWELDDEEAKMIHSNRKRTFEYMVEIVRENNLPGSSTLNEESVQKFVEFCNEDNIYSKIEFLESNKDTYEHYTNYWLELADCYFEIEDYQGVLDCVTEYKERYTGIFRKDYNYASILPKAIVAAQNVFGEEEYIGIANECSDDILSNSKLDDWAIRYFVAQVYMDLYAKTEDDSYLEKSYEIVLDNVNLLVSEQKEINSKYMSDVKLINIEPKGNDWYPSKEEKKKAEAEYKEKVKKIKALNKELKENRKTELPSLYEPLIINCELLFGLAENLQIDQSEKDIIMGILENGKNGVFVTRGINDYFSFAEDKNVIAGAVIKEKSIIIPVIYLTDQYEVTLSVGDDVYDKWKVTSVERDGNNLNKFYAHLTNPNFEKRDWKDGEIVKLDVSDSKFTDKYTAKYKVSKHNKFLILDEIEFVEYEK